MKLVTIGSLLMLLGFAGIMFSILYSHPIQKNSSRSYYLDADVNSKDHAIMVECDNDVTVAHVYEWSKSTSDELPKVSLQREFSNGPPLRKVIHGGIMRLAGNPTKVHSYLRPITDWARKVVPYDTPIYLQIRDRNHMLSQADENKLMAHIKSALLFETNKTRHNIFVGSLSLEEETVFELLSTSILLGDFDLSTYGILSVHGKSAGIAYLPNNAPQLPGASIGAKLHGVNMQISESLGAEDLHNRWKVQLMSQNTDVSSKVPVQDPCLPTGRSENYTAFAAGQPFAFTVIGSGNYSECRSRLLELLERPHEEESYASRLPLFKGKKLVATHGYMHLLKKMLGIHGEATVAKFGQEVSAFCSRPQYWQHYNGHHNPEGSTESEHSENESESSAENSDSSIEGSSESSDRTWNPQPGHHQRPGHHHRPGHQHRPEHPHRPVHGDHLSSEDENSENIGENSNSEGENRHKHRPGPHGGPNHHRPAHDHNSEDSGDNDNSENIENNKDHPRPKHHGGPYHHTGHKNSESNEDPEKTENSENSEGGHKHHPRPGHWQEGSEHNGRPHKHHGYNSKHSQNGDEGSENKNAESEKTPNPKYGHHSYKNGGGKHHKCGGRRDYTLFKQNCFVGSYVVALLEDVYGFSPSQTILWNNSTQPISWAQGFLYEEAVRPVRPPLTSAPSAHFEENGLGITILLLSLTLLLVGLILFLLERRGAYLPLRAQPQV